MIEMIFQLLNELMCVKINGERVMFGNNPQMLVPIEHVALSKAGVIEEFPDLKDNKDWKKEAVKRFKEHIHNLGSEEKIAVYIQNDLSKKGWSLGGFKKY